MWKTCILPHNSASLFSVFFFKKTILRHTLYNNFQQNKTKIRPKSQCFFNINIRSIQLLQNGIFYKLFQSLKILGFVTKI